MDDLHLVKLNFVPRSPLKRRLALGGGIAALLITAEYHGYVTGVCRWLKRCVTGAFTTSEAAR